MSFVEVLGKNFEGDIQFREVDLVESLPLPSCCLPRVISTARLPGHVVNPLSDPCDIVFNAPVTSLCKHEKSNDFESMEDRKEWIISGIGDCLSEATIKTNNRSVVGGTYNSVHAFEVSEPNPKWVDLCPASPNFQGGAHVLHEGNIHPDLLVRRWNLAATSRISIREKSLEFSRHDFSNGTVTEMESFSDEQTRDLVDKEKLVVELKGVNARLEEDLGWLLKEGVVRVVDKVIELPEFLHGRRWIKNNCWCEGEYSSREGIRKEIVVGTFNIGAASSTSSHSRGVTEDIDALISRDYDTLLNLGELDVEGLRKLCVCEASDELGSGGTAKIVGLDGDESKGKGVLDLILWFHLCFPFRMFLFLTFNV
ncbi:unnamed protein product [Lactuca virosa]|uniref:Uncharacterized protein n=1 Tax=Lactuca virosa TaxID=75947 RepID=A0AAU9MN49_9ASTR|nr:unnamed protein product [Lactuca virosa]